MENLRLGKMRDAWPPFPPWAETTDTACLLTSGKTWLLASSSSSLSWAPGPTHGWHSQTPHPQTSLSITFQAPAGRSCWWTPVNITHPGSTWQGGIWEVPPAELRSRNACQAIYQDQITANLPMMENRLREQGNESASLALCPSLQRLWSGGCK